MSRTENNLGLVLCQDCLRIAGFTDERHNGDETCPCGGDFCGCQHCEVAIACLRAGLRSGRVLDLQDPADLPFWCEETGTIPPPVAGALTLPPGRHAASDGRSPTLDF